jgi:signal peptidase I
MVILALVMALVFRVTLAQMFVIPSASMSPTLAVGDRIMVDLQSGPIHTGDIIVFHRTAADTQSTNAYLVKRVVGLPGQRIATHGTTVLVDGRPLAQPWLPTQRGLCARPVADLHTVTIPAGQYFVMGDCRGDSADSRYWGTVPRTNVVGKVDLVIWHHNHPWWHWF